MNTILNVGTLPVTSFGAGMALAALAALLVSGAWCAYRRVSYSTWIRMTVLALPLMLVMSRLLYVVGSLNYYIYTVADLSKMLLFWDGGASVIGALLGLIIAAAITEKWQKLPSGTLLDAVGFGAPIGIMVERLFEEGTQLGLGQTIGTGWMADHPFFAMDDGYGYIVHAVFRYEAVAAAVVFAVVLVWMVIRRGNVTVNGDLLLIMLSLFGALQIILESYRNDGHMLLRFVRLNQVVSIVFPVVALAIWTARAHRGEHGFDKRLLLHWLMAAAGVAVGIVMEFKVDSSDNVPVVYGIMGAAIALVVLAGLLTRRYAYKKHPAA